jgi:biotin synthase
MSLKSIDGGEALALLTLEAPGVFELFSRANQARIENRGMAVRLCGVVNAKSGQCTEDCKFCAQSAHNDAEIDRYGMMDANKMVGAAQDARKGQVGRFGIVTSGLAIKEEREVAAVETAVQGISRETEVLPCASLGNVTGEVLDRLKAAGLTRYHCNIETAESFFPQICTTRDWSDSVETIRRAKETGLTVCCGGILGLGETLAQRVEFLEAIRDLEVDSVPLNFLHPIPGTPLEHGTFLTPLDCLKVIAVARLMMPDKEIRVCGGREHNLRDLQSWALVCGADGLMVGGYLTTSGRGIADDLKMIADAGFVVQR